MEKETEGKGKWRIGEGRDRKSREGDARRHGGDEVKEKENYWKTHTNKKQINK